MRSANKALKTKHERLCNIQIYPSASGMTSLQQQINISQLEKSILVLQRELRDIHSNSAGFSTMRDSIEVLPGDTTDGVIKNGQPSFCK